MMVTIVMEMVMMVSGNDGDKMSLTHWRTFVGVWV